MFIHPTFPIVLGIPSQPRSIQLSVVRYWPGVTRRVAGQLLPCAMPRLVRYVSAEEVCV